MELSYRSTDDQVPVSAASVGRTGWDVLSDSGRRLFIFGILIIAAVALYLFKDSINTDFINENWPYVVPFIGGWFFYRWFVLRLIRNGVVIHVVGIDRVECYDVSRSYLASCKIDGIQNLETAANGESVLYALEFDPDNRIIKTGWCHDKDSSIVRVLSIKANYEKLTKDNFELAKLYYEILDEKTMMAKIEARDTVDQLMNFFADLSGFSEKKEEVDAVHEQTEEVEDHE